MSRIRIVSRSAIAAPAAVAWAVLADYAHDPSWRKGVSRMEQSTPGPVHDGARVVEQLRVLGRDIRSDVTVHDVVPGESFAWRVVDGADAHGVRRIVAHGVDRCELVTEKVLVLTGTERLLAPLIAWTIRRTEAGDARRAAALVEGSQ